MRRIRFGLALAGVGTLIVTVVAGSLSLASAEPGLPVSDLLSVEQFEPDDEAQITDHTRWTFEVFSRERQITEGDLEQRFSTALAADIRADDLSSEFFEFVESSFGRISFVRFIERRPAFARALGVGETGAPLVNVIGMADNGTIVTWSLFEESAERRLPLWLGALALLAGSTLIGLSGVMYTRGDRQSWAVFAAGALSLSGLLVLNSSSPAYASGRVLPALVLIPAAWLLAERLPARARRTVLLTAVIAALLGAAAPFTRDATLIGHPSVSGALTDSAATYRGLLGGSALLTAISLSLLTMGMVRQLGAESAWRRPPEFAALLVAVVWAVAAAGAAIDYGVGEGALAGALQGVALVSLAAVPVVLVFRLVTARWDRPELAGLVIELGSGPDDLRSAVGRALEDPTVEVLHSPDGVQLLDERRNQIAVDDLAPGRALTQVRFDNRLVGGLVHDAILRGQPDRLRAVCAALGPALDVGRLTGELEVQLAAVSASRRRIIEASDEARRRIERDLHDGAQQRLVALGIELQRARRLADAAEQTDLEALLQSATAELRGTIEDVRSVSRGSHPALLVERGLGAAVDALAERSPVPVETEIDPEPLPTEIALVAYYVAAEGLANVAKHSTATHAAVTVRRHDGVAHIEVRDDGDGGAVVSSGSGLQGLDDRVAAAGGTFTVNSTSDGTTLTAEVPCA